MILRHLVDVLKENSTSGKVLMITGPRQAGKTTLVRKLAAEIGRPFIALNGDLQEVRTRFADISLPNLQSIIGNNEVLVIDEAQRIQNIGLILKIIHDEMPGKMIIATGSSALELGDSLHEPLTGRKLEYHLYPISWSEYQQNVGEYEALNHLNDRLIYGSYPDVINQKGNEFEILLNLVESYLYKDLFALVGIRKPQILQKLTQALAFQVGNEVSYNELANLAGIDKNTVANYIDLLEKAFVIVPLQPLSRNLRNEISSSRKIYFMDLGVRNMLINDFKPLHQRQDIGALWENFLFIERLKRNHYGRYHVHSYFWRTHARQEIDYIEEKDGRFEAFEFKWNSKKKGRITSVFTKAYPNSTGTIVNRENFQTFLT